MNSIKEIGGYFGLELGQRYDNISDCIALNSARNALRYVIRAYEIKEISVPYYTCPVVWESLEKENCKINFYHINNDFMPTEDLPEDAYVIYTNYFGICAKNVKELAKKYKNLIVDNAQAFYMPKYGIASFNSIRKFFGVPDGALLYSDKLLNQDLEQDTSYQRCSHLLKRIDVNASFGYSDFQLNDNSLINEPIKYMSELTKTIFNSIDTKIVREKRLENFKYLHSQLSDTNELQIINIDNNDVPMVYPYLVRDDNLREKLIKNKIYIAKYWQSIEENIEESYFFNYLLPLPIDQRYCRKDIDMIISTIMKG